MDRQRPTRSAWAWTVGGGVAVTLTLVSMMLGTASGIVFGIPIAVVIAMATYHAMRARSIRALAPTLATTVGELAAPPREEEFPTPGGSGVGTGYPHLP